VTDISPDAAEVQARTLLALEPNVVWCAPCFFQGRPGVPATDLVNGDTVCEEHADAYSAFWDWMASREDGAL
jgi:hypothetical protein